MSSIQTGGLHRVVYLPRRAIRRPIVPVLDEEKIQKMIETLSKHPEPKVKEQSINGSSLQIYPFQSSSVIDESIEAESQGRDGDRDGEPEGEPEGLPPIDVLAVNHQGTMYYFGFGGCHRFQAYDRMGWNLVKVKLMPVTRRQLGVYLGASVDAIFE